jgi:hypothetical protein
MAKRIVKEMMGTREKLSDSDNGFGRVGCEIIKLVTG